MRKNILELQLDRLWRLTVVKHDVENEYLVPERQVGEIMQSIVCDLSIVDVRCVPYHDTQTPNIWMRSRAPDAA
jgi:hypothetical protein